MFLCTVIQDLIKIDAGVTSSSTCATNHYTRVRLERARLRRKEPSNKTQRCRHDNCLRGDAHINQSLQRIAHANLVGFCYWTKGKESLTRLFWAQQGGRLESSILKYGPVKETDSGPDSRLDFTRLALGIELEFLASLLPESQMNRVLGNYVIRNKGQEQNYRRRGESSYFVEEQMACIGQLEFA